MICSRSSFQLTSYGDESMNDLPSLNASESDESLYLNVRLKLLEKLNSSYWKSWHRDYLVTLQIRKRWLTSRPEFAIGDLVLIAEDNQPPLHWKMARVVDLYSGNDEINRVAKVKTINGTLMRAIIKLRKFPFDPSQATSYPDLVRDALTLTQKNPSTSAQNWGCYSDNFFGLEFCWYNIRIYEPL